MAAKSRNTLKPFDWQSSTIQPVVGVDEVGRGCLAGPVFAGAVILDHDHKIEGLTDSKLLSASRREDLAKQIQNCAPVGIGVATVEEIEELNILNASLLAMKRAVESLGVVPGLLLVDGKFEIRGMRAWRQQCLIGGELRAQPIAAASIVAKVARDAYMSKLAKEFPGYGLEIHKGYATKMHRDAISKLGPTKTHRRKFAGVAEFIGLGAQT